MPIISPSFPRVSETFKKHEIQKVASGMWPPQNPALIPSFGGYGVVVSPWCEHETPNNCAHVTFLNDVCSVLERDQISKGYWRNLQNLKNAERLAKHFPALSSTVSDKMSITYQTNRLSCIQFLYDICCVVSK